MKTIKFWSIITIAVFLTTMMFTSCEDPLDDPENQEVIESEVVDEGVSSNVTTQQLSGTTENGNTVSGTELSYESWIRVKTKTGPKKAPAYASTRAASGNDGDVVTVLLKDVFHNTDTTITLNDQYFDIGEYTTDISYYVKGTRQDGYVTITDSVMVYTLSFEDFSFAYELEYEVAVYDDGITKETMPYHKIKNLQDKGMEIVPIENIHDESLTVFARRQINHSITVEFCGETYTLKGKVILQTPFGTAFEPYVKKSDLLDARYYTEGGQVYSALRLRRYWSDGQTRTETITVPVNVSIDDEFKSLVFHGVHPESIELVSYELSDVHNTMSPMYLQPYVTCGGEYRTLNINYGFFEFGMEVFNDTPYYYDGYLQYDFPVPTFQNFRFSEQQLIQNQSGENESGKYVGYRLIRNVKADFDRLECEAQFNIGLVFYDE